MFVVQIHRGYDLKSTVFCICICDKIKVLLKKFPSAILQPRGCKRTALSASATKALSRLIKKYLSSVSASATRKNK